MRYDVKMNRIFYWCTAKTPGVMRNDRFFLYIFLFFIDRRGEKKTTTIYSLSRPSDGTSHFFRRALM